MELGLKGKVVVVTGGSKGIGYAAAEQFLKEGAKVAICARNFMELREAESELGKLGEIYSQVVDVTEEHEIYAFAGEIFEHFKRLDCWVNNVGASFPKIGDEYSFDQIQCVTNICFNSTVYGCQAAFRYMKRDGGSIVNISSLAARCGTIGRSTLYGPLKAAVLGLSVTFAGEYAAYGVRVNSILPGFTLTPKVRATISKEELERNIHGTLLHRVASPEEIANAIVFLCSDGASYITATSLEVSGGRGVVLNPSYSYNMKRNKKY
ncbi:SDR family oxidoreductase [Blautia liquoris]|uniref:SDR family oxidoreductase n=1 Tax=Blautia liquoris TaxID=2779518 RepID=A0A7M2RF57_9FIRM|nr:SDR family oxidoreductase [Blautia liquoris]QOV18604.1 SDR family oxidoreductase [Blautia liquoris]